MNLDSATAAAEHVADDAGVFAGGAWAHVVFVPEVDAPHFFVWGEEAAASPLGVHGVAATERVADETLQIREIDGIAVPLLAALPTLASLGANELNDVSPSLAAWSLAAKLALDLASRQRIVPRVIERGAHTEARSCAALALKEDYDRFLALAKCFPLAAHALPCAPRRGPATARVWAADELLRAFLNAAADALVRAANALPALTTDANWAERWLHALGSDAPAFAPQGFQERTLLEELAAWSEPALGADAEAPRVAFRLELPEQDTADASQRFTLRYLLQATHDPSLLVPAADVYVGRKKALAHLRLAQRGAEERLLQALSIASRLFPPIERSLHEAKPEGVELTSEQAWTFLSQAASALSAAGMSVIVPAELTRSGQRRLRMRMRIGGKTRSAGKDGASLLTLNDALSFHWEAALGGDRLTATQLKELAALKAPLVRYRGQWVAVDRAELEQAARLLAKREAPLSAAEALAAALSGGVRSDAGLPIEVAVEGPLANIVEALRTGAEQHVATPAGFRGVMRPYQERGLAWLALMSRLGLGACLADDMGLGKTIQFLAYLLHRREQTPTSQEARPTLLVCPTSVIGNWRHEIARFAPTLHVVQHYGSERAKSTEQFAALPPSAIVITSYGLLRRDAELLTQVEWAAIALDEAQNIKNPDSRTARVARALRGEFRVALTGTPVENRLAELWSIFEFLNPGLLGPLATFRREVAVPIERFGREDVAERLKKIVRPMLLRRVKTDPNIIQDLPPKQEIDVHCTLTREQASLYQSAVDNAMEAIEGADGIERRGQVLALITALKQICNHPAQYLGEWTPLAQRSGKLQRLIEMLDEVLQSGERALVFTQYREMGERLVRELKRVLRTDVFFLHGGTSREQRDAMVKRFQEGAGPRIFVLSVKAGGTGLNLTAASHVFHYDRWWNPAVEDQATDRAYRIGQQRSVQVHKFLCAGTVEERIDAMLKTKRDLAARIVGSGEQWITELDNAALRELFALSPGAVIDGEALAEAEAETV